MWRYLPSLHLLKGLYERSPKVIRNIYAAIPFRYRMGRTYRHQLAQLRRAQDWPLERWREHQNERLGEIVQHAQRTTEFYSNIDLDFSRLKAGDLSEFRDIEPISKEIVTADVDAFRSREFSDGDVYVASTGGTTGRPMTVVQGNDSFPLEWAHKIFSWGLGIGYSPSKRKATFRGVSLGDKLFYENPIYNEIRFSPFSVNPATVDPILDKLVEYKPEYLHGYPSVLTRLVKIFQERDIQLSELKGVIAISEKLRDEQKKFIENELDAPVYSFYGHAERCVFATQCDRHDKYHVLPTYGMVELLDEHGRDIEITDHGRSGEIVGTGFVNPAFPLLRYRTGDIGYWANCNCGLQTPVLGDIEGRWKQDWLVGLDGSLVSVTALNVHDDLFAAVRAMQFQQKTPGAVTLAIVPDRGLYDVTHGERIRAQMQKKVGDSIVLDVSIVDELSRTESGKLPYVRQEVEMERWGTPE